MSTTTKPALPPRRPSPALPPAITSENVVFDSPLEQPGPSLATAPPRLPPRKSAPDLPPIIVSDPNDSLPANIPMSNIDINPPTAITVTPATPSTPIDHFSAPLNGLAQRDYAATYPTPGGYHQAETPASAPIEMVKETISAQVEAAKPYVAEAAQMGKQFEWGLVTAALVLLAWLQVSLLWIILLGVLAVLWFNAHPEAGKTGSTPKVGPSGMSHEREAVTWV
jgi:hypothetical protein